MLFRSKPHIGKNGAVAPVFTESTDVFRDWLVFAFLSHRNAGGLLELMQTDVSEIKPAADGGLFSFEYITNPGNPESSDTDTPAAEPPKEDTKPEAIPRAYITEDDVRKVLDYRYPFEEFTHIPLKLSVSEIKERMNSYESDEENG